MPYGHPNFGQKVECDCRKISAAKMARLDALLSYRPEQQERRFATLKPIKVTLEAKKAVRLWTENPTGWRVLHGIYGSGKSTLAMCAVNELRERGEFALFAVASDLFGALRSTFDRDKNAEVPTFDKLFRDIANAPFLALDDIAQVTRTEWVGEQLFRILNTRYVGKLPTIITTDQFVVEEFRPEFGRTIKRIRDNDGRLESRMSDASLVRYIDFGQLDVRPLL